MTKYILFGRFQKGLASGILIIRGVPRIIRQRETSLSNEIASVDRFGESFRMTSGLLVLSIPRFVRVRVYRMLDFRLVRRRNQRRK